jgi:hypothetical protein
MNQTMNPIMNQMMKHANNQALTDQEFCEEAILFYTDVHRKRFAAGQNMIRKFREGFKRGDAYGITLLETLFPENECKSEEKEQIYRQQIAIERMERRMNEMEKLNQKTKEMSQEEFYDCQAELIQQKEYVTILQAEEVIRKRKMLQHTLKIKEMIQITDRELDGIEQTLTSITRYPLNGTIHRLKERKDLLLKQRERYTELLLSI